MFPPPLRSYCCHLIPTRRAWTQLGREGSTPGALQSPFHPELAALGSVQWAAVQGQPSPPTWPHCLMRPGAKATILWRSPPTPVGWGCGRIGRGGAWLDVTTPEPGHHLIRPPVPGLIFTPQVPQGSESMVWNSKEKMLWPIERPQKKRGALYLSGEMTLVSCLLNKRLTYSFRSKSHCKLSGRSWLRGLGTPGHWPYGHKASPIF